MTHVTSLHEDAEPRRWMPLVQTTLLAAEGGGGDTLFSLGPIELTESALDTVVSVGGRILLVLVISAVVVRVANRMINRAVQHVKDPDHGPVDRLKRTFEGERAPNAIAQARRERRAEAMASVGRSLVAVLVWTLAVLSVLATININLGPYIASLGIVGIALGFGAQDLVKDFISGVFMLLEDQYGVGDIVDSGEATGVVEGISLRTTRIRGLDGTLWYVPNGEIRRLGNMSQQWARALLDIGVAYDTDVDHAIAVIEDVAAGMAEEEGFADIFLAEPEVWGVETLGDSAIEIRLVIQTTPGDQWAVSRELRRRLKKAFDEQGIEIPFPQRMLWVREADRDEAVTAVDDQDEVVSGGDRAPTSAEELKGNPAEQPAGDAAQDVGATADADAEER